MYNKRQREKKSRNELTNSLRNVDAGMAMLLRIGLMRPISAVEANRQDQETKPDG
jgi:hypothetical protein